MCSLDRIYAMLDLERNNQADCSGIPAHQSHGVFTRGRPDFAPAQDRALLCEAISRGCRGLGIADSAIRS